MKYNYFIQNEASESGGCVQIAHFFTQNFSYKNIFFKNKSPYGEDVASYGVRIFLEIGLLCFK